MRAAIVALLLAALPAGAASLCATCHPAQAKSYAATGMGRALSRAVTQPNGEFLHPVSGTKFSVLHANDGMHQRIVRDGFSGDYRVAYVVGSGHRAFGYLIQEGDYLFQSPISYQTQEKKWIMAPGYEDNPAPDFNRPVGLECLLCHSGKARLVAGTHNRYENPAVTEEGISCERCHGLGAAHMAKPSRANIVNPARLAPDARDSVCEQCHLQGEARILNPGKDWADFAPGEPLEKTFTVFVGDSGDNTPLRVISQSQQLRRSFCWQKSGHRLWCGTCHDPHREPSEKAAYYRAKCLGCHESTLARNHHVKDGDCAGCHMPSRGTVDGAHAAFTDHQIRRHPVQDELARKPAILTAWRAAPEPYTSRNLGLAYVNVGAQQQNPEFLAKAFPLIAEARQKFPQDGELTAALGLFADLKGLHQKAAEIFELAVKLRPSELTSYQAAATAWMEAGNPARAVQMLEAAIAADPADETAYIMLAELFGSENNQAEENRVLDRYLKIRPQSIEFRKRRAGGASAPSPAAP